MAEVLLLQVGHAHEAVARRKGDYDRMFREGLGLDAGGLEVVAVCDGEPLPPAGAHRAVVVTGSFAMVTDRAPWSEACAAWLVRATGAGVAVLGVCYGHQLLAHAHGGRVGYAPAGKSIGTVDLALSPAGEADPLLGGRPGPRTVQVSHSQRVLELPEGAVVLAASPTDPHHAFRLGERAWGVQFHPEWDAEVVRGYVEEDASGLATAGLDPAALAAGVRESDDGRDLLRRFVAFAVGAAGGAGRWS